VAVENGDKGLLARLDVAIDKLTEVSFDIRPLLLYMRPSSKIKNN